MRPRAAVARPTASIDAVLDLDVAGHKLAADERRFDAEPHAPLPPRAARSRPRRRAARGPTSASMPARSATSATRASPSAAASAASTSVLRRTARENDVAPRTLAELRVVGRDADHQPGVGATEADLRHGRDRVQHEFLRRSRLQARRTGDDLGPDDGDDRVSAAASSRALRHADDGDGERAGFPRRRSAASVNGVEPLALTPTTTSAGRRRARESSVAPRCSSSSASSWSATTAMNSPGGEPNVGPHSAASSAASPPEVPAPT